MSTYQDHPILQVRPAVDREAEIVIDILTRAAEKLAAKGVSQWMIPWEADKVRLAIQLGRQFIVLEADKAIAVFELANQCGNLAVEVTSPGDLYLCHLAVDPNRQNQGVGMQVMRQVLEQATEKRQTLYLDCWAGNTKLRKFYTDCGMTLWGEFPEETYRITVFNSPGRQNTYETAISSNIQ